MDKGSGKRIRLGRLREGLYEGGREMLEQDTQG